MTNSFHLYLNPTIYINWINDAEINQPLLNQDFYYPLVFEQVSDLILIQEL